MTTKSPKSASCTVIKYRRKGGKFVAREVSEPEVYQALKDYLAQAGRSEALNAWTPLWTRHDRAGKSSAAPLGSRAFANNLKKYAQAAGIEGVHVHQTRHTYARIVAEETGSFLETQEALDHENAAPTRVYVQRIAVKADIIANRDARFLEYPEVGDPAAPPIRAERHNPTSIATMQIESGVAMTKRVPRCPFCQKSNDLM